jgi:hypothetical protein
MSFSLPSKETIILDVPEVRQFDVKFKYNFFVNDEYVNSESTIIPKSIIEKPSEFFDSSYIDIVKTRIPRYIRFDFTPVYLQNEERVNVNTNKNKERKNFLRENYNNIIGEDEFVNDNYQIIDFSDQSIDKKIYEFVSGTFNVLQRIEGEPLGKFPTTNEQVKNFNQMTPSQVGFDYIQKSLMQHNQKSVYFEDNRGGRNVNHYNLDKLKKVSLKMQINNKILDTTIKHGSYNPAHTIARDLVNLSTITSYHQEKARSEGSQVSQHDYMNFATPYDMYESNFENNINSSKKIIGYVIDKWELKKDGILEPLEPIILESPHIASTIDFKVKYGATYVYQIRTIAEYVIPSINIIDKQLVVAKFLISSKPTTKTYVECIETVSPPSPVDIDYNWNYEINRLQISWSYPPNSQRDIKEFQLFRRSSIQEPYELIAVYDFDDTIRVQNISKVGGEKIPKNILHKSDSPILFHIDEEFNKSSKFIYAMCSIDAHGYTSNYSTQMEITFDKFKNKLNRKLISNGGAPKAYPNFNLAVDTFLDVIYDERSTRMKLYFTPEYLELYNKDNQIIPIINTNKEGSEYRLQVINLDLQKEQNIEINIEDRRKYEKAKEKKTVNDNGLKSISANRF